MYTGHIRLIADVSMGADISPVDLIMLSPVNINNRQKEQHAFRL